MQSDDNTSHVHLGIDYNKLSPVIIYLVLAIKKLGACGNMTHGYNIMA
jgi:hypothetical protein